VANRQNDRFGAELFTFPQAALIKDISCVQSARVYHFFPDIESNKSFARTEMMKKNARR